MKSNRKETQILINAMKEPKPKIGFIKKKIKEYFKTGYNFNSKYYQGKNLLHYCIEYNLNTLIPIIIKYGCNPNISDDNYFSPLHYAVIKNDIKAVKLLIKSRVDINCCGEFEQTPLHLATINGNLKLVKLLIKKGADFNLVDEKNLSVLDYAKDEKNQEIIEFLENNILLKKVN